MKVGAICGARCGSSAGVVVAKRQKDAAETEAWMMTNEELQMFLVELRGQLKALDERMDVITHCIQGNGQPGLVTRLAKVEERLEATKESITTSWAFRGTLVTAIASLIVGLSQC